MMTTASNPLRLIPLLFLCLQSLADVALQEAERRRSLDQQGIEAKIIDAVPQNSGGNLTVSSGVSSSLSERASKETNSAKGKSSVDGIRSALRKLDNNIQQTQKRLEILQARLESERWAIPKSGRVSGRNDPEKSRSQLRQEIDGEQQKLDRLQHERADVYDRGKKAGFLPGELTGKGIIP